MVGEVRILEITGEVELQLQCSLWDHRLVFVPQVSAMETTVFSCLQAERRKILNGEQSRDSLTEVMSYAITAELSRSLIDFEASMDLGDGNTMDGDVGNL